MRQLWSMITLRMGIASLTAGALLLLGGAVFVSTAASAESTSKSSQKIITIYDNGTEKGIFTQADTLREALEKAKIRIDKNDITEPSLDEKLPGSHYKVNIYRARPVVVIDGAVKTRVMTPHRSAKQIAAQAGIALRAEDKADMQRSENLLADGAAEKMVITRAVAFTFVFYNKPETVYTTAATVGDMLKEKKISLSAQHRVEPGVGAAMTAGMTVKLWREGKQTLTVDEEVAFPVEQIKDANRDQGTKEVKTPGKNGMRTVTYDLEIRDGKELYRKELQSLVTEQPVKQVEIIGTKSKMVPYTGGGSKTEWLAAAGIPQDMWGYADSIVGRESGWNPNATNRSSGACGLAQALPCSKVPGNGYDPVDSLRWMNGYVSGRYGGWEGAYNFWQKNHWY